MAKPKVKIQVQPSSQASNAPRAKCGQCGKELRYLPFALKNIMCRECYGLERYRRHAVAIISTERIAEVVPIVPSVSSVEKAVVA